MPGIGILIKPKSQNDQSLLKHEFGHVLHAKRDGLLIWTVSKAIPSFGSTVYQAIDSKYDHHTFYTEMDAYDLSNYYFRGDKRGMQADFQ